MANETISSKAKGYFLLLPLTVVWTCVVHAFFISQLMLTTGGGAHGNWQSFIFYPHFVLMYILPPHSLGDLTTWKSAVVETISAIPASLLYGFFIAWVLTGLFKIFRRIQRH